MNKTIIAGLAAILLVVAVGTNMSFHSAEAKGMPQHWLKLDGTLKTQYLLVQKNTHSDQKYPLVHIWTPHKSTLAFV